MLSVDDDSHTERGLRPGHLEGPDLNVGLPVELLGYARVKAGGYQRNQDDEDVSSVWRVHGARMVVTRQPRVPHPSGLRQ